MLTKLLKYEFRWLGKIYIPIILAMVYVSVTLGIFSLFATFSPSDGIVFHGDTPIVVQSIGFMSFVTYMIVMIGAYLATIIIANYRFYKHNFSTNGYLTLTLPVTPTELYLSKFIASVVGVVVVTALIALSSGTMLYIFTDGRMRLFQFIFTLSDSTPLSLDMAMIVMTLLSFIFSISWYYFCICIGQTQKNKIVVAIITYFVTYTIMQILSLIMLFVVFGIFALLTHDMQVANMEQYMLDVMLAPTMWGVTIFYFAITVLFFLSSRSIMTKRINLD